MCETLIDIIVYSPLSALTPFAEKKTDSLRQEKSRVEMSSNSNELHGEAKTMKTTLFEAKCNLLFDILLVKLEIASSM